MPDFDFTVQGKFAPDCRSLIIDGADRLARLLLPHKEELLEINIKKFFKQRTIAQNSYMWGVVIPTVRAWMKERTGSCPSKEGMYAFLRIKVVGQEVIIEDINGIEVPVIGGKRFSQMTTIEFAEAVDKIVLYYGEQGLEIPLPQPGTNNLTSDYIDYHKLKDE